MAGIVFIVEGFDKLQIDLAQAAEAFKDMDGEIGTVSFDPSDPGSIERAIGEIHRMIDDRLGSYAENPLVGPMIDEMKEKYREGLLERAAAARLNPGVSDD